MTNELISRITQLSDAAELWLAAALLMALLVGTRLWRIARIEETQRQRLETFRGAVAPTVSATRLPWHRELGNRIAVSPIIGVVEQQRLLKALRAAGITGRGSLATFIAMKVVGAIFFFALAWILVEWRHLFATLMYGRLAVLGAGLMIGWRLPDFILNQLVKRRKLSLENGIPDALDLLVICAEAGLSLNQAIEEISKQLRMSNKDVADEFATTSGEMQVLPDFGKALDNLVERTGLDDLRSLTATLKQSLKFGTPLSESLRMIAAEMRAARHARIEEKAARLPVILAIPMMMFILPCVMMVVSTPVVLRIIDTFRSISIGGGTP
jgi:tight adherence protein C